MSKRTMKRRKRGRDTINIKRGGRGPGEGEEIKYVEYQRLLINGFTKQV